MDASALQTCQELIGYRFSDPELLALALTHASVAPTRLQSNERLEFLGDAVLGLTVCDELYRRCEDLLEGDMTKIKSVVVSRQICAQISEEMGIADLMRLGKGIGGSTAMPRSIAGAALEALIGAVYLDGGAAPAREFVLTRFGPHIELALADEHQQNYKSLLQQRAQRRWGATPEYHLLDEKGPDHSKCFEIAASVGGRTFSSAWGTNKKEAEQEAARRALDEIDLLEDD